LAEGNLRPTMPLKKPKFVPSLPAHQRCKLPTIACGLVTLFSCLAASADETAATTLQPGTPFADNAVFQQGIPLPIWGTARPGAKIEALFAGQHKTTTAKQDGTWRVTLDPLVASKLKSVNDTPQTHTLTLTSTLDSEKSVRELANIAIGDVWLCAGQSNIAGRMKTGKTTHHPENSIEMANYPALRLLGEEEWLVCSPETAPAFGKVVFFFSRRLQQDALIPIGLMTSAVGGSNIESWLNKAPFPEGDHYKNLITPLVGYGIRGAIWYQGEANQKEGHDYQPKLQALIEGWREAWGQGDFPFHYVQLPGLGISPTDNPAMGDGRAEIRQAYVDTLAVPNTGLAVTLDIGTKGEHPPNKYDTGDRLARSVLKKVYGMETITACPLYQSHKIEGNTIRVSFTDDAKGGLIIAKKATTLPEAFHPPTPTPDAKLDWLSIEDADGSWHWAEAKIEGSELIVSTPGVDKPIAVRYAYTAQPLGHLLYNKDGMPVGPFSTQTANE
jgi:sialate O-acetylesterase